MSFTNSAVRVLHATLDPQSNPMSLSVRLLKPVAIDELDDDKWRQLVFLVTHISLDERGASGGPSSGAETSRQAR